MPTLARTDDIYVINLGEDENVINPEWLTAVSNLVERVVATPPPRALVTTGSGKCFSLGLDLDWMAANPDRVNELVTTLHEFCARLLELSVPTVAAIQGHAFAGGALLALAHDHRIMREDRGYFCLPEIDGQIAFTSGLTDLVKARLAPQVAHEVLTSGRRYAGSEARQAGIADRLSSAGRLLPDARSLAQTLSAKDPTTYGAIKTELYRDVVMSLRDNEANRVDASRFATAFRAATTGRSER